MGSGNSAIAAVMAAGFCGKVGNPSMDDYVQHYYDMLEKMQQHAAKLATQRREGVTPGSRWT
jgi:hypothetical protein